MQFLAVTLSFFAHTWAFTSIDTQRIHNALKMSSMSKNHVDICFIFDECKDSFFSIKPTMESVSWRDVITHECKKMKWDYEDVIMSMSSLNDAKNTLSAMSANIAVLIGIEDTHIDELRSLPLIQNANAVIVKESSDQAITELENFGEFNPKDPLDGMYKFLDEKLFKKSRRALLRQVYDIGNEVWERRSADDILFALQCYIDVFTDKEIPSVRAVTSTDETGISELKCMCTNCLDEMKDCFSDPICRAALDCLNNCKGNDQVCSYRCITSYETPAFEKFALCILQRHNCMGNSAVIPSLPDPDALATFRGEEVTHAVAEGIFQGWLNVTELRPGSPRAARGRMIQLVDPTEANVPWSWKVVCGQNPAYDYFGCQHQIFYPKDGSKGLWYDPVFKVDTLSGEVVWRRRHYSVKVKPEEPGKFLFNVLDNGVMSNEYWRILDVADDLSWGVFYYSGAAKAAGTNYRGALLVTKDGKWPDTDAENAARIAAAFDRGGIKMWELFPVANESGGSAGSPPLGIE